MPAEPGILPMSPSPLLPAPDPSPDILIWIAMAVVAAIALFIGFWRWKKRRPRPAPVSDPRLEALRAIDQLATEPADSGAQAVKISLLLRRFIHTVYQHPALFQTPEQRRESLASATGLPRELADLISEIDGRLYGPHPPDAATVGKWTADARKQIERLPSRITPPKPPADTPELTPDDPGIRQH